MSMMNEIQARRSKLTPQQRALLEKRLRGKAPDGPAAEAIGRRPEGAAAPLSFAQQRLWFLDQWEPGDCFYNVPRALRFKGVLNRAAIEASLTEIMRRHEALRTTFPDQEGQPLQLIHPPSPFTAPLIDLSALAPEAREAAARALAVEEARTGFDLAAGPLLRVRLLRLAEDDHLVLFTMHHIITDGWSMGVLVREITTLYEAFSNGRPSPLAELPIQYADFAHWQRGWLQGSVLDRQLAYWKAQLEGCRTSLDLPLDYPRPLKQRHQGSIQPVALPRDMAQAIRALGNREGATTFMTLLAAFYVMLYRYSGQDDILIGTPIANRNREEIEELIGFFVNTLVLRGRMRGDMTFREFLQQVRETTLGAYAHQDLPFERLVEELQPERNFSQTPMFQVMFILQNAPSSNLDLSGAALTGQDVYLGVSKFDLSCAITETEQGIFGGIEYNTDLFHPDTARRMAANLVVLLESIIANPDQRIDDLNMMTEEDRRLLRQWNATEVEWGDAAPVSALFERQVDAAPEQVALVAGARRWTYAELDRDANRLAHHLLAAGLRPEQPVGLLLPRDGALVVATLAVLKAGGCYVPLDAAHPPARLAAMARQAGLRLLLCDAPTEAAAAALAEAAGDAPRLISLAREAAAIAGRPAGRPGVPVWPDQLLYLIFTSGSTGRPKGIGLSQAALANLLRWHAAALGRPAVQLGYASAGFDASFHEWFAALATGGRLVLAGDDERLDARLLLELLEREEVTRAILPVVMLHELGRQWRAGQLSRLRELIGTGEALRLGEGVRRLLGGLRGARLYNHYGPAETHVVTAGEVGGAVADWPAEAGLGRPLANCRVYVLDGRQREVGVGVRGEIYVGGTQLGRGYVGAAGETAAAWVPDGVSGRRGERLYRTGDVGRWGWDGGLVYEGRRDGQVKVRGQRVEVGEVEAVLMKQAGVREAVVAAERGAGGELELVAYLVGEAGEAADEAGWLAAVRQGLRGELPGYMVPGRLVPVGRVELTVNGKVDRAALRRQGEQRRAADAAAADGAAAWADDVEREMAGLWAEVLGAPVGRGQEFFEAGGQSLKAVRLRWAIRQRWGVEVGLREVFGGATVEGLSRRVREHLAGRAAGVPSGADGVGGAAAADGAADGESAAVSEAGTAGGAVEASYAVDGLRAALWAESQSRAGNLAYVLPLAWELRGELDEERLERAVRAIAHRHAALRSRVAVRDGALRQEVLREWRGWRVTDEAGGAAAAGEDELGERRRRVWQEEVERPFDLARGPLFRARLARLAAGRWLLVLTLHHLVGDGWSLGVVQRQVAQLYAGGELGADQSAAAGLDEWLSAEQREPAGPAAAAGRRYWRRQLRGVRLSGQVRRDGQQRSYRGGLVGVRLAPELTAALRRRGAARGASLYVVLLAGVQLVLSRYSGWGEAVVEAPVAAREAAWGDSVGLYLRRLVVRTAVEAEARLWAVVERAREAVVGGLEHSGPWLEEVLRAEVGRGEEARGEVVVAMEGGEAEGWALGGAAAVRVEAGEETGWLAVGGAQVRGYGEWNGVAKAGLWVGLREVRGGVEGYVNYDAGLYGAATAAEFGRRLERMWAALAAGGEELRVGEVELGAADEAAAADQSPLIELAL